MAQSIGWKIIKATGIIPVLFVMGLVLKYAKINTVLGDIAIFSAIFIGIIYAILGVVGILQKLGVRV